MCIGFVHYIQMAHKLTRESKGRGGGAWGALGEMLYNATMKVEGDRNERNRVKRDEGKLVSISHQGPFNVAAPVPIGEFTIYY